MTDFTPSPRELDLEARTQRFIRDVIIPYESNPRVQGPITDDLVQELRGRARAAGLLAPQVGTEWGGYGLNHRETATVLRASGYSLLGPVAMNCMAPDEGNMHTLLHWGTDAQKEKYLRPLCEGKSSSCFAMTEPEVAGSDPTLIRTNGYQDGNEWVINGHKWFTSNGKRAAFFIVPRSAALSVARQSS